METLQYLEFPVQPVPLEIHNSESVISQQCEQDDNGPDEICAAGQNAVHSVRDMADYSAWCRGVSYAEDALCQGNEIFGVNGENWDTVNLLMSETREAKRLFWMSSTSFCSLRRASFT